MRFDPEKSLFELPAVRWIFATTVLSAAIVVMAIVGYGKLEPEWSYSGFNRAIEIFRFPIGILAVGLSLIGLCGANHRSEQTRRQLERSSTQIDISTSQIEATRSQNNFANYYKHSEEFAKLCLKFTSIGKVNSPKRLHTKLFPDALHGNFTISPKALAEFRDYGTQLQQILLQMANSNDVAELINVQKANQIFAKHHWMEKVEFATGGSIVKFPGSSLRIPSDGPRGYLQAHIDFVGVVDEIFGFDTSYESPMIISIVSTLGLGLVPTSLSEANSFNFPELLDQLSGTYS